MKAKALVFFVSLFLQSLVGPAPACAQQASDQTTVRPLDKQTDDFILEQGTIVDGLSKLSFAAVLHLGIEEIPREELSDPPDRTTEFSMHLHNKRVRDVLDALCQMDARYTWSKDGETINVYPRYSIADSTYLLNLRIERLVLNNVQDATDALTPLSHQFPDRQLGYIGMAINTKYSEPWTTKLDDLTVRQFINRISEHMGEGSVWIYQGGHDSMMFWFLKGAFHT